MGSLSRPLMALATIWNFFLPISLAVDRNCDYREDLIVGKTYFIYNKEYPQKYSSSANCRWQLRSSEETRIVLSCTYDLPLVNHRNPFFGLNKKPCEYQDKVLVSTTGQNNLGNGKMYCGNGTFSIVSDKNSMSVALLSTLNSHGGTFYCTAATIEVSSPVPAQNVTLEALTASCDCGWRVTRKIVGGEETGINEFPYMAGLVWRIGGQVYCGANIISDRYLLTAAHCVYNRDYANMAVLVGDHNITAGGETSSVAIYSVTAYEYYPEYNPTTLVHDIAILKTDKQILFSAKVAAVCLPFRYTGNSFYGETVTVLGWGATEFTGPRSDVLLKADLTVTSNSECAASSPSVITSTMMCTYTPGKDACSADSGGPLLWTDRSTSRMHLIGVISQGLGCGSAVPTPNSRVTSYLSWIVSRTPEVGYCIR